MGGDEYGPKEWKYVRNTVNSNPAIKKLIFGLSLAKIRTLDDKISKSIAKIFISTTTIEEVAIGLQHLYYKNSFDVLCDGLQKNNSIKTIGLWDGREQYIAKESLRKAKNAELIRLVDAVKNMKNVHKIRASSVDLTVLCDKLKELKNITYMQLSSFSLKDLIPPLTDLLKNTSHIKGLMIGSPIVDTKEDVQNFMDMLISYNWLTRLKFKRCSDKDLSILGINLNRLKDLKELSIEHEGLASITPILEPLKYNYSITHLKIKIKTNVKDYIQTRLREVLEYNRALNTIIVTKNSMKTLMLEEKLSKNKLDQEQSRSAALILIQMIALRRNIMTSVLPLEIWIMILTYMNCPGVPIDFGSALQRTITKISNSS
jgi:hypothetical protein